MVRLCKRYWLIAVLFVFVVYRFYEIWQNEQSIQIQKIQKKQIEKLEQSGFDSAMLLEVRYFPVAVEQKATETGITYEDGYGDVRTYGGERKHEGCDIMALDGRTGYYPVVSMTDGIVEKVGWLELGGYRVGVRSPSGVYYYYAHLDSFRDNIKEGQEIKAGELLGFLGDSGYGTEGTTGQFPAHLHLGIYLGEEEEAINPYPVLVQIENNRISFVELEKR